MAVTGETQADIQILELNGNTKVSLKADTSYRHNTTSRFAMKRVAGDNAVAFLVNPSECSWTVGTRTSIEKISGGAVHHEWPQTGVGAQEGGSRLDQPIINFSFQSGIITHRLSGGKLKSYTDESSDEFSADGSFAIGLNNFYDFLSLLDQPNLTPDGLPNYVNINYHSAIFANICLQGFFTEAGVAWTDSGENPHMVNSWGASFMVFKSVPGLTDKSALVRIIKEMLKRAR